MTFTWASKRRFMIIGSAAMVGVVLIAGVAISILYDAPSCMDGRLNQDETGIDCGGSCEYLCRHETQEPRISFVRVLTNGSGRTDVIAYVENRNQAAEAKDARYTVEVFDDMGTLLGKREGMLDLPARATVPLYIPGVFVGVGASPRAFVSFDEDMKWRNARRAETALEVRNVELVQGLMPRVNATLMNPSPETVYSRTLVATVFDAGGVAIGASQTVVRQVPGLGTASAVFTWPEAFPGTAVRVEVTSVPLLP